jgi:tetratricopeptide (TPR) repeat protein
MLSAGHMSVRHMPDPDEVGMFSDRIKDFADGFDVGELILRYDADFDVPLRHGYALGILRMVGAFDPAPPADPRRVAVRVGAHWCEIVRCDVNYDLVEGLRLIAASQADAERLRAGLEKDDDPFIAYVVARWFDGAGKIRYRLGSHSRARISFETAAGVAAAADLAWCLPDLRSNFSRSRFEELRQASATDALQDHLAELVAEDDRIRPAVTGALAEPDPAPRERELIRAHSSLLHNIAVALKDQGRRDESMARSIESLEISRRLGDQYRIGQSLSHQALLQSRTDKDRARWLFAQLEDNAMRRHRLIGRQQLAGLDGATAGIAEIRSLLAELAVDGANGGGAGTDVDIYAYSVQMYEQIVRRLRAQGVNVSRELADLTRQRKAMRATVRVAVTMPAYKRAYAQAVRPSFLEEVAAELRAPDAGVPAWERALGLTEESTARELLDMLAAADLPELGPPGLGPALPPSSTVLVELGGRRGRRRAAVRRVDTTDEDLIAQLGARETEFEEQFLRQPLEASPHDPEIAHRLRMYTVNHPGTCVVRYVAHGPGTPDQLGAFVFRDGNPMKYVPVAAYADVRTLAAAVPLDEAPSPEIAARIWAVLIEPIWPEIDPAGDPDPHLVLIPTDDLFAIPIHVACRAGERVPLGARVPLSQSVSATAFVGRGRHLLRRQPVDADDNLAAIVVAERGVSGREIVDAGWPPEHIMVAGDLPAGLPASVRRCHADFAGLAEISGIKPEFFVYAGHGNFHPSFRDLGPYLELRRGILTQYDVALRLRLPRNKLTILGACLAGQGAQTAGGDVVGFLRSLIAAGAGAVGVPLWSVLDSAMVRTVRALLAASRASLAQPFDVVRTLHEHYAELAAEPDDLRDLLERMPISLYL